MTQRPPMLTGTRLQSDHENALLHVVGMPSYHNITMACDRNVREGLKNGYGVDLQHVALYGFMMGHIADAVAYGIELGRRLERTPTVDTLYGAPCEVGKRETIMRRLHEGEPPTNGGD